MISHFKEKKMYGINTLEENLMLIKISFLKSDIKINIIDTDSYYGDDGLPNPFDESLSILQYHKIGE